MERFDHEKLDVYQLAVEFLALVGRMVDSGPLSKCRLSAVKHLDDASQSIANNIAEGNGKRSTADRARYLEIARGSALECAACLDGLVARERLSVDQVRTAKALLIRIVSMLSRMVDKLVASRRGSSTGGAAASTSTSTSTSTGSRRSST